MNATAQVTPTEAQNPPTSFTNTDVRIFPAIKNILATVSRKFLCETFNITPAALQQIVRQDKEDHQDADRKIRALSGMRFNCVQCGRSISPKENHAVCKPCRPSNRRYEQSERRRFRKAVFYYSKLSGNPPTFSDAKFTIWIHADREIRQLRRLLSRIRVAA